MSDPALPVVEAFFSRMADIRSTGGATSETSYYGALETLLNHIGAALRPRVIANGQIRNQGAGHPDFGLYTQAQCRGDEPASGQGAAPERGVIEVKGLGEENWKTAATEQVSRYWQRYGLVLVTNYRDYVLVGRDKAGAPTRLEAFSLASTEVAFWDACRQPKRSADSIGPAFAEYLRRALTTLAPLTRPADLAWLLASYARDSLRRVEAADLPALATVRAGLEQALGLTFEGDKGEHFFRSTLVQTLFYGVFSSWVQWAQTQSGGAKAEFDWQTAGWHMHVPMVRNLFEQVATPTRLGPLGLVEVLNWTGDALNRVDRRAFFVAFDAGRAVQYFYEPFLAQFDPQLRKELGVWYTPPEIVRYMVERVDTVLRTELGLVDGLADPDVYILDPCCGTGSFLVESLELISDRLAASGSGSLLGQDLKHAATSRVFGFEIMPAPFVVAHWQIGALLAAAGAPLSTEDERAAIYLTNALTGWDPPSEPRQHLLIPELEPERDASERVKQATPILVVIGNPPYNAFAGTSPDEEDGLVEPYKTGLRDEWGIKKYNLDELYSRFLRLAERRIVEQTGRGVICYVSSYSYLSDPSFVVARRRLLAGFDKIWIDSLNGDSRETGKRTPDGRPDPSVFSTEFNRAGIKLGAAVGLFVRRGAPDDGLAEVRYRDFWGAQKREDLQASLDVAPFDGQYLLANPSPPNRFDFRSRRAAVDYGRWPSLRELAEAEPFSGLQEMRYGTLIKSDRGALEEAIRRYLNPALSFESVAAGGDGPTVAASGFDPRRARERALAAQPFDADRIKRYGMFPLENRWCYLTDEAKLWNRSRPEFASQIREGNRFIISRMMAERPREGLPVICGTALVDYHLLRPNVQAIPFCLYPEQGGGLFDASDHPRANLSGPARRWLSAIGWPDPDENVGDGAAPWMHVYAITCSPAYLADNSEAVLGGWPRIPLPCEPAHLRSSVSLGERLCNLLDPDAPVDGVTAGKISPPFNVLGSPSRTGGGQLGGADFEITAGWGHGGNGSPVMPARGRFVRRAEYEGDEAEAIASFSAGESESTGEVLLRLGPPIDVYLNDHAYLRAVPTAVWEFTIGGYQVFKKWLSYRELSVLGRAVTPGEIREGIQIIRRLTAVILLAPELDANYRTVTANQWTPESG